MKPALTDDKFAFVELCKLFLGYTHIPGKASGFNPSPEDEVICLDMCLSFPQELIDAYLKATDQGFQHRSLRHLAHGVVNFYYDRENPLLEIPRTRRRIMEFVREWKEMFKP